MLVDNLGRDAVAADAADLVAHAIHQSLAQVGLQCAFVPRLERLDVLQGLHQRFLDDILGVAKIARPRRQAAARPPPQRRQIPGKQIVAGVSISQTGTLQQLGGFASAPKGCGGLVGGCSMDGKEQIIVDSSDV